jgi:hypothetical protein
MSLKRQGQSGFAVLETILILIIVGLIGFTGWYVWHSKQNANDALSKSDANNIVGTKVSKLGDKCSISSPSMEGRMFVASDSNYTYCLPNGWELQGGGTLAQSSLFSSLENPTYSAATDPKLLPGGGGDGIKPLFVLESDLKNAPKGTTNEFAKVGSFETQSGSGTEYEGTQTKADTRDVQEAEPGTVEHLYVVTKGNVVISFDYFVLPGKTDNAVQVKAVAQTVKIN